MREIALKEFTGESAWYLLIYYFYVCAFDVGDETQALTNTR